MSTNPAIPAAPARPMNGASTQATLPDASAISPTHSAYPIAADGEIASPGSVPKAVPASHAASARTAIAAVRTVTCAASFSSATRRRPNGAEATNSRLPRRASLASVPESARIDQIAAMNTMYGPYFQAM